MPRISQEESDARRTEIIDACAALYRSESYHDITMTQVAANVHFGRANIYNYFRNKDEILLALLRREHELWAQDLRALAASAIGLDDETVAERLAERLERRTQMLKLLAMNLYDMEQNSRVEHLVEFKRAYASVIEALHELITTVKPDWDAPHIDRFTLALMPFLHGIYPYAFHSDKQLKAMREAGMTESDRSVRALVRDFTLTLLHVG